MQLGRRQSQRLGDMQRRFERQRRIEVGRGLAELDEIPARACVSLIRMGRDINDPGTRMLAVGVGAASSQREQHCVGGHGRMSDERQLFVGIEEAQPNIMIGARGGEHEGDLGV